MLKTTEIFSSVQGEGIMIGTPMIFIRTYGCNLKCRWCDTPYSWARNTETKVHSPVSLHFEVWKLWKEHSAEWICFTGGEPFIQEDLDEYLDELKFTPPRIGSQKFHWKITAETNGTICPTYYNYFDFLSISPKLGTSGQAPDVTVLKALLRRSIKKQLKFVVSNLDDIGMTLRILNQIHPTCPVVLQPNGRVTPEDYLSSLRLIWKAIQQKEWKRYDVRVIPQLHVMLFGHIRGV